jgi:DNA ligase D-like protein (predicted ligase)
MLAIPASEPFDSPEHIFELMWGGLRAIAYLRDGHLRLRGRNDCDFAACFPELGRLPEMLDAREAILDGEIIAIDRQGQPAFDALRPRLRGMLESVAGEPPPELRRAKRLDAQLSFQAFDLLWLDGRSLTDRPLWQRKNRLHELVRAGDEFAAVDFVNDEGVAFFEAVVQRKLEGVVAKQKASVYSPGMRSRHWLEVRSLHSGDFVVGGFTFGGARRKGEPFSQLLLGAFDGGHFEYVGAVSGGMHDDEARQLIAMLEPAVIDGPAFADPPVIPRLIYWTKPVLVCHVRFSEWSPDGFLRFPIFSALRPDLNPIDCTLDD